MPFTISFLPEQVDRCQVGSGGALRLTLRWLPDYTEPHSSNILGFFLGESMVTATALEQVDFFIGGERTAAADGRRFESFNPTTGQPWASVAAAGPADVERCVRAAREAFRSPEWRSLAASDRGLLLFRLADAIEADAERIGSLETRDNGKLYREMLIQLQLVPKWIRYFAGMADKVEGTTIPLDRQSVLNYTVPEP